MSTVLVTGATSGIGRATALALATSDHEVYAVGRSQTALQELRAAAPGIVPIAADVTDRDEIEAAVAGLHVDVLINNAGVMPPLGNFAEMEIADIDNVLETNLSASIILTRLLLPQMCARQSGHILFTGSSAAHAPFPNVAVYSATKAAIAGFAAALRADVSQYGVRVTEIVPGRVETRLYQDILDREAIEKMYANGVAVQPEDVASMIVAVLALQPGANVTRFDIMPTRPTTPSGSAQARKS